MTARPDSPMTPPTEKHFLRKRLPGGGGRRAEPQTVDLLLFSRFSSCPFNLPQNPQSPCKKSTVNEYTMFELNGFSEAKSKNLIIRNFLDMPKPADSGQLRARSGFSSWPKIYS